jgi:hypothetical protein
MRNPPFPRGDTAWHSFVAAFACAACACAPGVVSAAPIGTGAVTGVVKSVDGTVIANAVVTLNGNGVDQSVAVGTSGSFAFSSLPAGAYNVRASAPGYDTLSGRTIQVSDAQGTAMVLTMSRSASSLLTIGQVEVNSANALSTSTAPTTVVNTQAYAGLGYTLLSDVLQNDISTTVVHPLGGSSVLPTSVALRGPDPTETLVDIDGHPVNSGNSGDFDLSLLDPADYQNIELVKGIAPTSLVGPDTIDGAINIRTIEPTTQPHGLLRFFAGSYDTFGETLQATGTDQRLGYGLSLHRTTTAGEVNQNIFALDGSPTGSGVQHVGSALDASTALGKLRYTFGRGDGYVAVSFHDQSQFRDLSAGLSSYPPPPGAIPSGDSIARRVFGVVRGMDDGSGSEPVDNPGNLPELNSFAGSSLLSHNAGYGIDVRVPLGPVDESGVAPLSLLLRHYTSLVSQSVNGPAANSSPYLYNDRDLANEETIQLDRQFSKGLLTLQYDLRNENLQTNFVPGIINDESVGRRPFADAVSTNPLLTPFDDDGGSGSDLPDLRVTLTQVQRSAALRYIGDPSAQFHFAAAVYDSTYSTFGTSIDPRVGIAITPSAQTVIRASVGTTFQTPQLPELLVPPVLPPPVGGYIQVGNPNLKPDRATEYTIGIQHIFSQGTKRTDVSIDAYRVNLRTPAAPFLPPTPCGSSSSDSIALRPLDSSSPTCPLSFPVNAGNAVYQGIEIELRRALAHGMTLSTGWAVKSAYLTEVPPYIQDGTLVVGEQSLGLPLHKATLRLDKVQPQGLQFGAGIVSEGLYNELNQPPFTLFNANIGYRFHSFEVALAGTNLTNVYDQRFTKQGLGVLYGGLTGPLGTDALMLQGTAVNLIVTKRF